MSLWTSLEPSSATVDPGSSTTVRLRLRNTGDVVDEYRCTPVGDLAPYITVEPPTLRLYPGTADTVLLTFAPPRTPDATAGPNAYGVQVVPTAHPEATTVPEGNLTITPFSEIRAELVPHTVKGRFRGRPRLAVDNLGNTKLTASVAGTDNGDQIAYEIHPANVQIEPGRAAFVKATLRPQRITWFGRKENRPYRLSVQRSGTAPLDVDGTYVQRGVLPRWLATSLGLATGLAVAAVALWFAHKPHVASLAQAKVEQAAAASIPTPPPPTTAPPVTTAPATTAPARSGGSGGGSGGQKKPPAATAATAVQKLAASSPGRHICYRVYMNDKGWTKPSCDGATAGLPGEDVGIESVNIAVSGTKGTAGNGFMQYTGYKQPNWTSAVDGIDLYLGEAGKAKIMTGFTINVGADTVCENTFLHGSSWGGLGCDKAGNWIFAGSTDNDGWLEAIRLTV